jgi:hypothetical protein
VKQPDPKILDSLSDEGEYRELELADLWADIVCGGDKQDVSAILVAPKGYGKSHTGMGMCYDSAGAIAERRGGTWKDYFPYDEQTHALKNVACIVQKDIVQLMGVTTPYNVYLLDDVAVGMNARKFASDNNILINEIFQLMRVDRCVTITTTMDQSYVDKVPREIIGWYIEIVEPHHDLGYNVLKVFRNKKQFRTGKMHQVYITDTNGRYTRFITEAPPDFLGEAYDMLRTKKTQEHRKARLDEYMQYAEGEEPLSKSEQRFQNNINKYGEQVRAAKQEGKSEYQIGKELGISKDLVSRIAVNFSFSGRERKVSVL